MTDILTTTDILITAVLAAPIIAGAGYLLRRYPREAVIVATEGGGWTAVAGSYMATFWLVPLDSPMWQQVLSILSFTAVALALGHICARRMLRRLNGLGKTHEPEPTLNNRNTEHGNDP